MLSSRRGFTLVEVIVAIFLIDVGLLALVGSSALLVRQTHELRLRSTAVRIAANRLESLGAAPCSGAAGSAVDARGLREDWTVSLLPNRVRELRDSVAFHVGARPSHVVLRTRLPC